jgi:hypothetical protein
VRREAIVIGLWPLMWMICGSARADECPKYTGGISQGLVSVPTLVEASGLAGSRLDPGVFWSHNDSGSPTWLYALDGAGRPLAVFDLPGTVNVDWEDVAIGPGPIAGVDYIYLADIGDNASRRDELAIYRVPEPAVTPGTNGSLPGAVALRIQYPDGPHNAETLLADPITGDLYIVTKSYIDPTSRVYRFAFPHDETVRTTVDLVGFHTFPGGPVAFATTGGDISPEGDQVLIRTYTQAALWTRLPGETVAQALARPPCDVPLAPELQGEAIAFAADGSAYYTTSEQAGLGPQPLNRYARLDATSECSVGLSLRYTHGTLEMYFELGTSEPAAWNVWLWFSGSFVSLWSLPVPVIDPPAALPTLAFPFPQVGEALFITGLSGGGFACWNWEAVDTGQSSP